MHDTYSSPLAERYASKAMLELWSPRTRYGFWGPASDAAET